MLQVEERLQDLAEIICQLEKKAKHLESTTERLHTQVKDIQENFEQNKAITIENMTYKIQELTVNELHGTLNIGMTALADPEEIKQWLADSEKESDIHMQDVEKHESENN